MAENVLRTQSIELPPRYLGVVAAYGKKAQQQFEMALLAAVKEAAAQILNAGAQAKKD